MVREITLAKQLATNQWRGVVFGKKAANLLILLFIALPFILYKYIQFLSGTVQRLVERKETYDLSILFFINIIVWLLPVWNSQQISFQFKITKFFPFNTQSLFLIKLFAFFLLPATIFAVTFSGASFYPVFYAAGIEHTILYAICVISFSIFADFTFINILNLRNGRSLIFILVLLLTIGPIISSVSVREFSINTIATINYILSVILFKFPIWTEFFLTATTILVGVTFSFISLKIYLEQENTTNYLKKLKIALIYDNFKFSKKYSLLIKKDLNYLFRLSFAPYLSLLITLYYSYFLIVSNENAYQSFSVLLSFIFMPHILLFYNFFGFDKVSGVERYALFPISPSQLIKIKNLTAIFVSSISCFVLLPVIYFKFNLLITTAFSLKWGVLLLGYLNFGNFFSVVFPYNRRNARNFPSEALFGYAGTVLITSFVLILAESLGTASVSQTNWISGFILIFYLAFYFVSLEWNNRYLNSYWEKIYQSVT